MEYRPGPSPLTDDIGDETPEPLARKVLSSTKFSVILACGAVLLVVLLVWNITGQALQPLRTVVLDQGYRTMAFSANGDHLAVATGLVENNDHSNMSLLDARSLRPVWTSVRVPYELTHLEFVSQDFGFVAAVWANPLVFRDIPETSQARLVQVRYDTTFDVLIDEIPGPVTDMAVSPDRHLIAICSEAQGRQDATCRVFRLADHKLLWAWSPKYCQGLSVAFSNDSQHCLLATQLNDFRKTLWT